MSTTKKEIIDYVTTTPYNTNPVILSQKLDEFSANGGSKDAVQYIPQELTEEQQMQARANLGLYGETIYYETVAEYDYYAEFDCQDPERIKCEKMDTIISTISETISTELQLAEYRMPMAGTDIIYWHGNCNLIPDSDWSSELSGEKEEQKYSDLPFVIYYARYELGGNGDLCKVVFDDSIFDKTDRYFTAEFIDKTKRKISYNKIPEEYLPPVIVKDNAGFRYTIIVNDDGTLSAVMV